VAVGWDVQAISLPKAAITQTKFLKHDWGEWDVGIKVSQNKLQIMELPEPDIGGGTKAKTRLVCRPREESQVRSVEIQRGQSAKSRSNLNFSAQIGRH